MKPLTALTVSYGHGSLMRQNLLLAESLHKDFSSLVDWHVAENSPPDHPDRLSTRERGFIIHDIHGETGKGISHHHATALNALLRTVPLNRHVLILDPDFFLLVPNWAEVISIYMAQKRLSFFGVPWHPRHHENYRYFPAVHCFAFDSQRIQTTDLDFTPLLDRLYWRDTWTAHLLQKIPALGWRLVRSSWDTGTRVFDRFNRHAASAVATPIYRPPANRTNSLASLLDALLPDRYCLHPKRADYYTQADFQERGWLANKLPEDWEAFVWQERPFGLHVRRSFASQRRHRDVEEAHLELILSRLAQAANDTWPTFLPLLAKP
jgi:hypothetical protein